MTWVHNMAAKGGNRIWEQMRARIETKGPSSDAVQRHDAMRNGSPSMSSGPFRERRFSGERQKRRRVADVSKWSDLQIQRSARGRCRLCGGNCFGGPTRIVEGSGWSGAGSRVEIAPPLSVCPTIGHPCGRRSTPVIAFQAAVWVCPKGDVAGTRRPVGPQFHVHSEGLPRIGIRLTGAGGGEGFYRRAILGLPLQNALPQAACSWPDGRAGKL